MNKIEKEKILYPDNPNGIYKYEYVNINGIKQYIQIRGVNKNNPLLLFIHGGPGGSFAGLAHVMQDVWENDFTVVNWDQRNACKTYLANIDQVKEIAQTGTMEDYIKDIDGVIEYLHTVYDFEKIIILGFSWGSVIGSEYVKVYPQKVSCYIGVGQLVNYIEGFHVVCGQMRERAEKKGNKRDVAKINQILENIPSEPSMMKSFTKYVNMFSRMGNKYMSSNSKPFPVKDFMKSPLLDKNSRKAMFKATPDVLEGTFKTLFAYDFRDNMNYDVPVVLITGEEDTSCPHSMLKNIVDKIEAPNKELIIVEKAGHCCFYDKKEEFFRILKRITDGL